MGSLVGRSVLRVLFCAAWKRATCAPRVSSAMAQRRRRQALRTNSAAVTSSTESAGARVGGAEVFIVFLFFGLDAVVRREQAEFSVIAGGFCFAFDGLGAG